jgi:hypothetical protein
MIFAIYIQNQGTKKPPEATKVLQVPRNFEAKHGSDGNQPAEVVRKDATLTSPGLD